MLGRFSDYLPRGGTLPDDAWVSRHRATLVLLWAHSVAVPGYALARGYALQHVVLESLVVPVAAVLASIRTLPRRGRTMAASLGLLSASGVLVHLSGGLIEMHFHFFVMVTVISLYQDWITFTAAVGYVLVHHGLVGALDPDSVYNHPAAINSPWKWAAVHAFFVTGASAASVVSWRLNERYLAERRRAEDRLREEQRIVQRLNEVGRMLVADLDFEHLVQRITDVATDLTAAQFGAFFYNVKDETGESYLLHAISGAPPDAFADLPLPRNTEVFAETFSGRGVVRLDDVTKDPRFGHNAPYFGMPAGHLPVRSYLAVPVVSRREVLGGLFFAHEDPGRFTSADEQIAVGIAAHAAVAFENARLFAGQRAAAETLQHALLPDRLPVIPGVEVAARYVPAGPGAEVGGDWYDVIALRDGKVGLVMGDVVGHGIEAASLMGQLRNAVRAYAIDDLPPAAVLDRLNTLVTNMGPADHMATALYAVYDPETNVLRLANAGHPPPVLRSGDNGIAATSLLGDGLGVPLGAIAGYEYQDTWVELPPGGTLVLYTDGLVEDPLLPLDRGITAVQAVMATQPLAPEELCERLVDRVVGSRAVTDDLAVLALRTATLGPHLHVVLPVDASTLRPLRALLRRWLVHVDATEQDVYEILVAATEACSNVIRHASGLGITSFELEAHCDDGITIVVRNEGRWRDAGRPGTGGRGLDIIEEFMDAVEITRGPPETVIAMRRTLPGVLV